MQVVEENDDIVGGIAVYLMEGDVVVTRQLIFIETKPARQYVIPHSPDLSAPSVC